MTRRLDRYARALPILAMAAGSALLSAQSLPTSRLLPANRAAAPTADAGQDADAASPNDADAPAGPIGAAAATPDAKAAPSSPAAPSAPAVPSTPAVPAVPGSPAPVAADADAPTAPRSDAPAAPAPASSLPAGPAGPTGSRAHENLAPDGAQPPTPRTAATAEAPAAPSVNPPTSPAAQGTSPRSAFAPPSAQDAAAQAATPDAPAAPASDPRSGPNSSTPASDPRGNANATAPALDPRGNPNATAPASDPRGNANATAPASDPRGNPNAAAPAFDPRGNANAGAPRPPGSFPQGGPGSFAPRQRGSFAPGEARPAAGDIAAPDAPEDDAPSTPRPPGSLVPPGPRAPAGRGPGAGAIGAAAPIAAAAAPTTQPVDAPATAPTGVAPQTGPTTRPTRTDIRLPDATSRPAQLIKLEFKDASLNTVVDYLSDALGFVVKKTGPIEGRISLVSRTPVTPEIALTLLDEALAERGMTAVQTGRILTIVTTGEAKKITPVRVGNKPEEIAETAEWITQVIPVANIDAVKLRQDIQPLISGDADFAANQGSNSLILTDTSKNIKRIVTIISKLDENTGKASQVKIYHLQFANATTTAKLLTTIFAAEAGAGAGGGGGGGRGGGAQRMMQMMMGGGGGGAAGGSDTGKTTGKVTATPDDRTNNVVVVAPHDTIELIDKIVKELDSDPTATSTIKTFQLQFADAPGAAKLITTIFGQDQTSQGGGGGGRNGGNPFGPRIQQVTPQEGAVKVTAAAADKSNTLVVTAPPGVMSVIEGILKQLDEDPAARSQVTVFQLKFADSDSAAKLINSIFQSDTTTGGSSTSRQGGGAGGGFGNRGGGGPQITGTTSGASRGYINAVSDPRTNTVVVTAPSDAMRVITGILEKLDSNPSSESALFIYHLRNGVAADIQQTLSALFSTGTTGTTGNTGNRTSGQSLTQSGLGSTSGFGGTGSRGASGGLGGTGGGLGGSSGSNFGQPLSSNGNQTRATGATGNAAQSGASSRATSELVGQVIVVADNDTNSLLVSTASKYREQITKIIQELDRPVPQVLIKVLIAEVTHDRSNDFGFDFSVLDTRASGKGLSANSIFGNVPSQATNGGLAVSLAESQLNATLHALSTEGKLDVLSRPYILASDNQLASITVGQEVPFITNTQITDTGQQINTITYQAVGIILNVTPHINPDGAVTLDVSPEISAISATTVPIGNGIQAPVIDNRSAQSRVTIRNGDTIVIGGMMQDQKTVTINKIPLLGDIPYLGSIFARTQTAISKTELLIFLTPHVAPQTGLLQGMSQDEVKGLDIVPTAVKPGTFGDHMRGLERGATPQPSSTQPAWIDVNPTPSTQPFQGINISGPATEPAKQSSTGTEQ